MGEQEKELSDFFANTDEESGEEFDQAFEKAARLKEIEREIAETNSSSPEELRAKELRCKFIAPLKNEVATIVPYFKNKVLIPDPSKPIPDKDRITSTTPFTQAIEKMYRHYYNKGEYNFIRADYVDAFIQKMGELRNQENIPHPKDEMELISYLAEHIKSVKKSYGAWKITIEEKEIPAKRCFTTTANPDTYDEKAVSKKLCQLRIKHPIHCTIPTP